MRTAARRLRVLMVPAVLALGAAVLVPSPAGAQPQIGVSDVSRSGLETLLVGGDYAWRVDVYQPWPAEMWGVPAELSEQVGAAPVTATFAWGDGTATTISSATNPAGGPGTVWCNSGYTEVTVDDVTTYVPDPGFGYGCWAETYHSYATQGVFAVTVHVEQESPVFGLAVGDAGPLSSLVVDLAAGGSLTVKGTVYVPAGNGGMYDTDFTGGLMTVQATAKRKSGTTATTASVLVSVPTMTPDWPLDGSATGMTFTGKAAMAPLLVSAVRGGGEAYLMRVEGTVTSSAGYAGGAWANLHAIVKKGEPTLLRVGVHNTSAGYTYVDSGYQPATDFSLDPLVDRLLSGSVKIG